MKFFTNARTTTSSLILLLALSGLQACGGGGGGSDNGGGEDTTPTQTPPQTPTPITSFELIDPTPGASDEFGRKVLILGNGNILVSDPFDSSVTTQNGAVHLYNPNTQTLVASFYGDPDTNQFGFNHISALANNNFVIALPNDSANGFRGAGSVRLINGTTGIQIGSTLSGDLAGDGLGSGGLFALANNNFVVVSTFDDEAGFTDAGSVRLVDGETGVQIGEVLVGDADTDRMGSDGIIALANNNFIVVSLSDDENGVSRAGSVRLVDGTSGQQIGTTFAGDNDVDLIGSDGIAVLPNNNFTIASHSDDDSGLIDVGSVRLVDGETGLQIGAALTGELAYDKLGSAGVTALSNNNFVIASHVDNELGVIQSGSVRLVDGTTALPIGATHSGDISGDQLGSQGTTALPNGNFIITSIRDDEAGVTDAGSVILVDGITGVQIGATFSGDVTEDRLGSNGIIVLANNNFVISSTTDDMGEIQAGDQVGSAILVSGTTGVQIGDAVVGNHRGAQLGFSGVKALANSNFVIASQHDADLLTGRKTGVVQLIDGATGSQIGRSIIGDIDDDQLGGGGITVLSDNKYIIASRLDDAGGVMDAGSIRLVDGITGAQIGSPIVGNVANDLEAATVTESPTGDYYILSLSRADKGGLVNSGSVYLVAAPSYVVN